MKMKRRFLSILLSLVMVLGLVIGMSSTAYADYAAIWSEDQTISMDTTIDGGVAVSTDAGIKLTIAKGVTLTVNGGITAGTRTLTIEGKGTLVVNGADQNTVGTTGDKGSDGRDGTYAQNCGGAGKTGGNGAGGGVGIEANLVVNGVTVIVTGGTGGKGGKGGDGGNGYGGGPGEERRPGGSGGTGGTGGAGGVGIKGSVTVNSGSITVTGGAGGDGGDGGAAGQYGQGSFLPENKPTAGVKGQDGSSGQAVSGTITGYEAAQESDDASTWTAISGTSSTKRYVKVAHLHSFTYSASGATITATCGKTGCDLTENKATLTIAAPELTTYGETGKNAAAMITDANGIKGEAAVKYYSATVSGTTYTKSGNALAEAPVGAGNYVAEITLGTDNNTATAAVGYTIAQKEVTVSGITASDKVYDGNTDATLVTTAATVTGKLDGDALTVSATGTFDNANVGENKTVTISGLTLDGTSKDNYKLASAGSQTTAIANITAKEVGLEWSNTELTYNGEAQKPTATATGLEDEDTCTVTVTGEQTNAGENYTATAESLSNSNYKLPENKTTAFKITKADAVAAAVTANNRTYDGTEKPLVTVTGEATGSEMQYALGTKDAATEEYTTSIPAKTTAGTYYVWYRVEGDENHYNTEAQSVEVTIAKATPGISAPTAKTGLTYIGSAQELINVGSTKYGTLYYAVTTEDAAPTDEKLYTTSIPTKAEAGTYNVWYYVKGDGNHLDTKPAKVVAKIVEAGAFGTPDFTLPASLQAIEANAFEGASMTVVYIPDTCAAIGAEAFKDCAKLKQIRLPKDCAIEESAFDGCGLVYAFAPAGGTTEAWCAKHRNICFIARGAN